ncbi:allatostatin-A receptor-like [Saccoglossus kowalevskii]|uniref:Allatostatin-A receptor-like n=1 Tax=Saccoglossus kowalevskii TaxID=10224 RepID=A0ABM0MI08_SACKO|nr:PREDICTED: allatostatin-A receptor-like [Saccoglossus kowalevskii]
MNTTAPDNTTEETNSSLSLGPAWTYVQTTETVIAVVGILSNLMVIIVMLGTPSLRSHLTSRLTASLAVADLLASAFLVPRTLRGFFAVPSGIAGEIYCRTVRAMILWVSFVASTYTLVAIALERYFAIVHPLQYNRYKGKMSALPVIVCVWLLAFTVQSFNVYNNSYDPERENCRYQWPFDDWYQTFVGVGLFFATYFVPGAILLVAFVRILLALRESERKVVQGAAAHGNATPGRIRTRKKIIKMFIVVCLSFLLCWGPNQFLFLILNIEPDTDVSDVIYNFTRILAGLNSCLNPFIYTVWNKSFRNGIVVIFCRSKFKVGTLDFSQGGPSHTNTTAGQPENHK